MFISFSIICNVPKLFVKKKMHFTVNHISSTCKDCYMHQLFEEFMLKIVSEVIVQTAVEKLTVILHVNLTMHICA